MWFITFIALYPTIKNYFFNLHKDGIFKSTFQTKRFWSGKHHNIKHEIDFHESL